MYILQDTQNWCVPVCGKRHSKFYFCDSVYCLICYCRCDVHVELFNFVILRMIKLLFWARLWLFILKKVISVAGFSDAVVCALIYASWLNFVFLKWQNTKNCQIIFLNWYVCWKTQYQMQCLHLFVTHDPWFIFSALVITMKINSSHLLYWKSKKEVKCICPITAAHDTIRVTNLTAIFEQTV